MLGGKLAPTGVAQKIIDTPRADATFFSRCVVIVEQFLTADLHTPLHDGGDTPIVDSDIMLYAAFAFEVKP